VTFVEQGHIRVGPDTITDPAYLVTRNMEDYVTWVDTSKLRRTVMSYNDEVRFRFPQRGDPMALLMYCSSTTLTSYEVPIQGIFVPNMYYSLPFPVIIPHAGISEVLH
jgi:hypothetical protein